MVNLNSYRAFIRLKMFFCSFQGGKTSQCRWVDCEYFGKVDVA